MSSWTITLSKNQCDELTRALEKFGSISELASWCTSRWATQITVYDPQTMEVEVTGKFSVLVDLVHELLGPDANPRTVLSILQGSD